jgi:hypothetical protein
VTSQISIAAFVSERERTSVEWAADQLAQALSQAAQVPWTCAPTFTPTFALLQQARAEALVITSLLPELESEEPWPKAEQRLRTAYTALSQRGTPIFICTILRHVGRREEPQVAERCRIHIRRLNLLAAEISHETGAYVIDLDRVLSDLGARRLQTDYSLKGSAAVETAGHFIAQTLASEAIDALVSAEIQEKILGILARARPALAEESQNMSETILRKDVVWIGQGRRKQRVLPVHHTADKNYAGWLVRQILRGAIGPGEALQRFVLAVKRRGVLESASLIAAGLSRQIQRKP